MLSVHPTASPTTSSSQAKLVEPLPLVPSASPWNRRELLRNRQALGNQGGSCGPQIIQNAESTLHLVNWELTVVWERVNVGSKSFYCPFSPGFSPNWPTPNRPRQAILYESESEVAQSCPTLQPRGTVAYQAPQSMEFSRQEYWSRLPFPSPGDLPTQGLNPGLLHCRQTLYRLSHQGLTLNQTLSTDLLERLERK